MSKSAVMGSGHQPPDGDQHPDHGLVRTAWSPVRTTRKHEKKMQHTMKWSAKFGQH